MGPTARIAVSGTKIRQTIADIGGMMPESYEAVPHVKDARKRLKSPKSDEPGGGNST